MSRFPLSPLDRILALADHALRALDGSPQAARPKPVAARPGPPLDDAERRHAGALMRVDHVGEVCAQALYSAQALTTADPELRRQFERAAGEETDHLAWTAERLDELGARPSLLNPLWYAGAFAIGLVAGRAGDATSLGFLVETERQVERHLDSHLERLPGGRPRLAGDRRANEGRRGRPRAGRRDRRRQAAARAGALGDARRGAR